jgi:hypothetical protein
MSLGREKAGQKYQRGDQKKIFSKRQRFTKNDVSIL